jgi:hypothetical protein
MTATLSPTTRRGRHLTDGEIRLMGTEETCSCGRVTRRTLDGVLRDHYTPSLVDGQWVGARNNCPQGGAAR